MAFEHGDGETDQAIAIANALLDEGYNKGRAVAIATAQAEKRAKHRDKLIRKKNAEGSTGQAVKPVKQFRRLKILTFRLVADLLKNKVKQSLAES